MDALARMLAKNLQRICQNTLEFGSEVESPPAEINGIHRGVEGFLNLKNAKSDGRPMTLK